jgi:hypothetical protein
MAVTPAEMGFPHVLQLARLERIRVLNRNFMIEGGVGA